MNSSKTSTFIHLPNSKTSLALGFSDFQVSSEITPRIDSAKLPTDDFYTREGLHKWWRSSSFMLAGEGLRHFRAMFPTTWRLSLPLESVQRHYAPWVTSNLRRK